MRCAGYHRLRSCLHLILMLLVHRDHMLEREIDAALDRRRGLRHLVNPEPLSLAGHDQPKTLTEFEDDCLLRSPVSKLKAPCSTKREAGYGREIPKTRFRDRYANLRCRCHSGRD